jgi:hypothetical protein
MLNISCDKRISFERFEKQVGHYFKAYPNLDIKEYYEKLTGRKVGNISKSSKKSKKL